MNSTKIQRNKSQPAYGTEKPQNIELSQEKQ